MSQRKLSPDEDHADKLKPPFCLNCGESLFMVENLLVCGYGYFCNGVCWDEFHKYPEGSKRVQGKVK